MNEMTFLDCTRRMPLMALDVRTTVLPLPDARVLFTGLDAHARSAALRGRGHRYRRAESSSHGRHARGRPCTSDRASLGSGRYRRETSRAAPARRPRSRCLAVRWLDVVALEGMPRLNESVVVHRPSRPLLVGDLLFNMPVMDGLGARLVMSMFGTRRRVATSRLFVLSVRDEATFRKSLERVLALDFDRVIPTHGVPVGDGKIRLRAAWAERGYAV